MRVTRRTFMQVMGATAGAAALARGYGASGSDAVTRVERWAAPEEATVASLCQQCPGGCGLLVRTLDGQVAGVRGNPLHPINRGSLCPKAFGALQLLYDPDRLKGPMIREREHGRQRPIGWDEALRLLTARLGDLRTRGLAHTVAILGGQYRGYRDTVWSRFAEAYGTPNYLRARCLAPEQPALAHRVMQGVATPLGYDLAHARCVLSFGVGLLEAWLGPVHASRALMGLSGDPDGQRARLIHVDPRRSLTAAKADLWVPIVPGTDGMLALGIANALIREGLYDRDFVEKHTLGFEDWIDGRGQPHPGFKDIVLGEYGLLAVAAATGVPVKTILTIARDLAGHRPALVIGDRGPAYGADDLHTRMAIHSLNALLGNIGIPGGLVAQTPLPLTPLPPVSRDDAARQSLDHARIDGAGEGRYLLAAAAPQTLPDRILGADPYPINALFLVASNPIGSHPAREAFARALDRVPFVVSFSPFLDESTAHADLLLPDHTYLERWQDDQVTHLAGFSCFSLAEPATAPRHDTRDTADVVLQLARSLGGSVAHALPWETFDRLLYSGARGLYEGGRGHVVSGHADESLRRVLEREGYWAREFTSYDAFWTALRARGAWWDPTTLPVGRKALLTTPSGKFEFYASALRRLAEEAVRREGSGAAFVAALGGHDRGDRLYLPLVPLGARPPQGQFSLRLNTYRLATRPVGGGRNQPWLLEQPAAHVRAAWERWVEVHPDTARRLGLEDGAWVWVESTKGRVRLRLKHFAGTRADVVSIPLFGGEGPNQNDLIANEPDPFRGFGLLNTTWVRLARA